MAVGDGWCWVSWMVVDGSGWWWLEDKDCLLLIMQHVLKSIYMLLTVTWCNWKIPLLLIPMMCCRCKCSILSNVTIFDNDYNAVSHEFQQNANGIPWNPLGIVPRSSWILTISIGIPWKKVGISMKLETKMAEAQPIAFH